MSSEYKAAKAAFEAWDFACGSFDELPRDAQDHWKKVAQAARKVTINNVVELEVIDNDLPSEQVLQGAIEEGINNIVVLGYDKEGDFYFASARADGPSTLWLLEQARHRLINVSIELEKNEIPLV